LLTTLSTQASSKDGPTITGVYELWLPQLVADGIAAAAPEEFATDITQNYSDGIVSAASIDENIYGYPNEVVLYALNYNKALFAEAGIDTPPSNWEELVDYAKKLTKKDGNGRIEQQGFGLINSWDSGVVHPWMSLVYSNGGQLLTDDYKPLLDSEEIKETTKLYDTFIFEEEVTDPEQATANASTTGPYLDNFANGKTAMIIMANWWESALKDSMGDDFENIATAPIPVGPSGNESVSVFYSWMTMVNAHASEAEQQSAWEFLQWLNTKESGENGSSAMGDLLMGMGIIPSNNLDIDAHQDSFETPFLKTYIEELETARPLPAVLGGSEVIHALQIHLEEMEFGSSSYEDALTNAQEEISNILQSNYE